MVYYTGDIHGERFEIIRFCKRWKLTNQDVIVILGDAGINYFRDERDDNLKSAFSRLKPTIFCIHGNHEIRPATIETYQTKLWNGGLVWYETEYPNILFAKDGEIFTLDGLQHLVIGGAYSVDKAYRLSRGYGWWADEQPSDEIKQYVEAQIRNNHIDVILSHTCPFKYEPLEALLPIVDQNAVDASTEIWLNHIEESVCYRRWLCGHWHINKRVDKMHFLFHDFISSETLKLQIEPKEDC